MKSQCSYIDEVRKILDSPKSHIEAVDTISELELPSNAAPIVALIYGESKFIESTRQMQKYLEEDGDAKDVDPSEAADYVVQKIVSYINDFDREYIYAYQFRLVATYQRLADEQLGPNYLEYIDVVRKTDAKTITQVVAETEEWKRNLPRTLPLFIDEERECLFVNCRPAYKVVVYRDAEKQIISSGIVEFGDERDINTWMNNLTA